MKDISKHVLGSLKILENFTNDLLKNDPKKASNLSYWIKNYTYMLKRENAFHPKYLPTYKKGSIIFVDLGFNVGSEHGGLHYVIVLDKNDSKNSPTLTVLPMSSMKNKTINDLHPKYNYYLGDEFYNTLEVKMLGLFESFQKELKILQVDMKNSNPAINRLEQARIIKNNQKSLQDCMKKARSLKSGGYAVINQITTISKMRIMEPTKPDEPLYNVTLSGDTMSGIDAQIMNCYLN